MNRVNDAGPAGGPGGAHAGTTRAFRAKLWHQHQTWLPVGLIGSVVCMAMSGGITNGVLPGSLLPSWLSLFWLGVMTLLIEFGVFRVHAGARWEERVVAAEMLIELGVPPRIALLARNLRRGARGATLVLGELGAAGGRARSLSAARV